MHEYFEVPIDKLHPHQKEYYEALCKMKEKKENFHSIICIPTGGGKTRLAITYAINEELNKGKRILWIAHSHYLLDQAYDAFYLLSDKKLCRDANNMLLVYYLADNDLSIDYEYKQVRCVGDFASVNCKKYDVIVASIQSILNYVKKHEEKNSLEKLLGSDICIIVDEVHHLGAPAYYELLDNYAYNKTLIGLSATPVRKDEGDYRLSEMFFDDLGVTVNMEDLIINGYLIKPIFENVSLSYDEKDDFRWKKEYDKEVYNRYIKNQDRYGKTVIFANSIEHAEMLYDLFLSDNSLHGRVYLIHSCLKDRFEQFSDFKDSEDGILINVNIMNEGVDIPDIKTVFLTKPVESSILVTQCIGRALRTCKGKDKAYVVNFAVVGIEDKWYLTSPEFTYGSYNMVYWSNVNHFNKLVHFVRQQLLSDLRNGIDEIDGINQSILFSADEAKTLVNYDKQLMECFMELPNVIALLYLKYLNDYSSDYRLCELNEEIIKVFEVLGRTGHLWILQQVGIDTKEKFTLLLWNQFVNLKYKINFELSDLLLEFDAGIDNFINIDIVKVYKQFIFDCSEEIKEKFLKQQSKCKSFDEKSCWNDILKSCGEKVYDEVVSEIVSKLNCCANSEAKGQLKKSLCKVEDEIILQVDQCIKNKSENKIQSIIDNIFDKKIINSCCRDYNAKMLAEKIQKYCDSGKWPKFREKILAWYYKNNDMEEGIEWKKEFEKRINKYWVMGFVKKF